jgi:hypothetical protein
VSKKVNSNLEAALAYARRGWYVYPAYSKTRALVRWGTEATTDEKIIRGWWVLWPDAIVCIACGPSGLAVIDLDIKDGHDGPAVFAALEKVHGTAPRTLMQRTGSGGTHLIFRGTIKTTRGALGDGIDTRGKGGMIVAAPSIVNGKPYVLLEDELTGELDEPADLPQWAVDLAGKVREREVEGDGEFKARYTAEEFEQLLNLIPVEKYDDNHDAWLELMLACTHASTVDDGEEAFMKWTTKDGPGNRIGYASDFDMIAARWRYNFAKRNMKGGRQVGSFNMAVLAAAPNAQVKGSSAEDDFGVDAPAPDDAAALDALAAWWKAFDKRNNKKARNARAEARVTAKKHAAGQAFVRALKKVIP